MPLDKLTETRQILIDAHFLQFGREYLHRTDREHPVTVIEWWQGDRGVVILEHVMGKPDQVLRYANWACGVDLDEFKASLNYRFPLVKVSTPGGHAMVTTRPQGIHVVVEDSDLPPVGLFTCRTCQSVVGVLFGGECSKCASKPLYKSK